MENKESSIASLEWSDVCDGSAYKRIGTAFGRQGQGILVVNNVPNLEEHREKCFRLGFEFANLKDEIKEKYVQKESFYSFGWSHGKEKMSKDVADLMKGSYYANPEHNKPYDDPKLISQRPTFCHPNIWPEEIPEFESCFMNLSKLILEASLKIAKNCDLFLSEAKPNYEPNRLFKMLSESKVHKARFLHYFPVEQLHSNNDSVGTKDEYSSWCGWHCDHGALTGLTRGMFLDEQGLPAKLYDPNSGLYIKTREGDVIKADIPQGCLAFQVGETSQILSGGELMATPHCVKSPKDSKCSRETMAVFLGPTWSETIDPPKDTKLEDIFFSDGRWTSLSVPKLADRWKPGCTFDEFSIKTFSSYY